MSVVPYTPYVGPYHGFLPRRYTRGPLLGAGTYGEVHKVTDAADGRVYALKTIKFRHDTTAETSTQWSSRIDFANDNFESESRMLARCRHRNIIRFVRTVHPTGADKYKRPRRGPITQPKLNCPGMLLELADYSLEDVLADPALWTAIQTGRNTQFVYTMFRQMVDALAHLESRGVLHRDIKPGNIMVNFPGGLSLSHPARCSRITCKLGDFGFARPALTPTDAPIDISGTTAYMAPEQARGRPEFASDLYSLYATVLVCLDVDGVARTLVNSAGASGCHRMVKEASKSYCNEARYFRHLAYRNPRGRRTAVECKARLARFVDFESLGLAEGNRW